MTKREIAMAKCLKRLLDDPMDIGAKCQAQGFVDLYKLTDA